MAEITVQELQDKLDVASAEIRALKEATAKQKVEWEKRLKEESYEQKVITYQQLYKEAFGTLPPGLPSFNPTPAPAPVTTEDITGDGDMEEEDKLSPLDKHLHQSLQNEGLKDDNDPQCSKVPSSIADALELWFWKIHSGSEVQDIIKQCECPKNCSALKVVQINPEIKKWMNRQDEQKDQRMKWLCMAAPKAAQPLVCTWHQLAELEFAIQQDQDPTKDIEDAMVPLSNKGENMSLSSVICDLKYGIKCIGLINMQCVQKRHLDLQYKLAGAAKELAEPNQPFDDHLFGLNVDKHLIKNTAGQ